MAAVTVTIKNILGDPVQGVLVSAYDQANALSDSDTTDSTGLANLVLTGSAAPGTPYRVTATKDKVAGGGSTPISVVT